MMLDGDGSEYDWTVGYGPPPEKFETKLQKSLSGGASFKALTAAFAANPKDEAAVFGLARKYAERYDDANRAKALEKYKEVIALDPNGQGGSYTDADDNITAPYTMYAEYALATMGMFGQKPDMEPVKAFVKKYPDSPLAKSAYRQMAFYYSRMAPKEEADKFFADYTAKFPSDARAADMWLARIVRDKGPLEQGAVLADKIKDLTGDYPVPDMQQDIAGFYFLKGDKAKADEVYGKSFIDDKVQSFSYDLMSYANFWLDQKANEDSAVAMAELAYKLQPNSAYILRQLADVYLKTGHEDKALAIFGPEYLRGVANDPNALYGYAGFWSAKGKNLESALEAAKKAVDFRPSINYYWSALSDVYLKMKNYPEALKAAEKAVELTEAPYQARMKQKVEAIKKAQAEEKK
jgi:tetratricopeptide (TPR) repeat protein